MTTPVAAQIDWQSELLRNERWLRTIVYARLGESGAVDDVFQEIALAAVKQSAPIADATKVGPWLYRLAVRQVLLYRRKMGRKRRLMTRYADVVETGHSARQEASDPIGWLLAEERRGLVRRAVKQLRPADAEILLLKYAENWSYFEIANRLNISHSAVEARLHRARERLRNVLSHLQADGLN